MLPGPTYVYECSQCHGLFSHPVHGVARRPGREVNSLEDEIQARQAPEGACK